MLEDYHCHDVDSIIHEHLHNTMKKSITKKESISQHFRYVERENVKCTFFIS